MSKQREESGTESDAYHEGPSLESEHPTTVSHVQDTTTDHESEESMSNSGIWEDSDWESPEETTGSEEDSSISSEDDEETEDDPLLDESRNSTSVQPGTPSYEEPKFIVFFSILMSLFTIFCFKCKEKRPTASMKRNGTMVTVLQHCSKCGENAFKWQSQPLILGKYPAGKFLLSFAVLMAGASISKVLLVFKHLGLSVYDVRTYLTHQRKFLFPLVLHYWEKYRASLVNKIKGLKDVVWSGDGRFDSMGHSAKFGAYTMFCSTILKVVHFEILQANETGGSSPMELEGAKRAFSYLASVGLTIVVFVSDRHRGIAKWIRECHSSITHYFDVWHVARSIQKALLKICKEKGCEVIKDWLKGIRRHLYWCATSTKQGFGGMILAKWKSFMRHIANRHDNHPDPLYKKCTHGELPQRRWIKIGTKAYDKLNLQLMNTRLLNDIKKLSSDAQTSCLEGFHATLNHWHPKMICFSWLGTYCRHALASLHFNENVRRGTKISNDGKEYVMITYPKFKMGEEVLRKVSVPPTYVYVQEMRKILFSINTSELKTTLDKYSTKVPKPLNSQFINKKSKAEAMCCAEKRERTVRKLCPEAREQDALQAAIAENMTTARQSEKRKAPTCRKCGKLKKGHSKNSCE